MNRTGWSRRMFPDRVIAGGIIADGVVADGIVADGVTRNGEPLVIIYPANPKRSKSDLFGCMKGSAIVTGDIVNAIPLEDQRWNALK